MTSWRDARPTPSYDNDRTWSDLYLDELRRLIGPFLLMPSSLEQDRHEASDLVVLVAANAKIACRVRRPGYAEKYPGQFTVRSRRENGATTELRKMLDGWGDWFFYGHATGIETRIHPWWLLDLKSFRAHLLRPDSRKVIKHAEQANGDGTFFRWFAIDTFPQDPRLVIAKG